MAQSDSWNIHIDTGGTFTDCIAQDPEGKIHRVKVLSNSTLRGRIIRKINPYVYSFEAPWAYAPHLLEGFMLTIPSRKIQSRLLSIDYKNRIITLEDNIPPVSNLDFDLSSQEEAPVLGIRLLTHTGLGKDFPAINLRLGTTKGTNALLEKKGADTLLVLTKGFGDLLRIGTQQRPNLFQLDIPHPELLYRHIFELDERIDASGAVLRSLSEEELVRLVEFAEASGCTSVAVSLLNAYQNPAHEILTTERLRATGRYPVSSAAELFPQLHYLRRTQTAVVDAYLSPIIDQYLLNITRSLQQDSAMVMSSAGALITRQQYRAKDSLLSGPAGGMIAATRLAYQLGFSKILTVDMGGTSTDTARMEGRPPIRYVTRIDQQELFNPCFAIETVAAGGGSVCWFDGYTLRVGPQSAGAAPGPACYNMGGPLTITDVNLLLGKLDTSRFEIPISVESAVEALHKLMEDIQFKTGNSLTGMEILLGLERIANEKMAEAIRKISVSQGVDPNEYALMAFGGAGGLHACQLADLLGCHEVIIPFEAGLFSATGMGQAQLGRFGTRQVLKEWELCRSSVQKWIHQLESTLTGQLIAEGIQETERGFVSLFMRYQGQETALEIPYQGEQSLEEFKTRYFNLYGYLPESKPVELESIRIMVQEKREWPQIMVQSTNKISLPPTHSTTPPYSTAQPTSVYNWDNMKEGHAASGPCIITGHHSTTYVSQGWEFQVQATHDLILRRIVKSQAPSLPQQPEEVELELFTNRFSSIAVEMGLQLQRTAFSVNIKERLDFSCALLDQHAELLVNAPHIPVHLGSLGLCARLVKEYIEIGPGDVIITNHPKYGGSHLPDVTLLAGVYTPENILVGYVINRAHHAEIGGTRPGSMPPDARNLHEEGVVILPRYLVRGGVKQWDDIRNIFQNAPYPTRMWAENEADIIAALSSLSKGQDDLLKLVDRFGLPKVHRYMAMLKSNAAEQLHEALFPYMDKKLIATEFLDDGHRLSVQITLSPTSYLFDFRHTSRVHPRNLNANLSIIHSAILYVLRLLVNKEIPLNDGLMQRVQIELPPNSLLHPDFVDDPAQCPAVVGGNTEVSQRLVDTLLKPFGAVACSQGTMNNFLFGNHQLGYYETMGGGAGAGPGFSGRSGVHQHMTNTRITDSEELERRYPIRIVQFGIRNDSGGKGKWPGGDGLLREIEFLESMDVTLLGQHRHFAPYGLLGGTSGKTGDQTLLRSDGRIEKCPGIASIQVFKGDRIRIETPGGGAYGESDPVPPAEL